MITSNKSEASVMIHNNLYLVTIHHGHVENPQIRHMARPSLKPNQKKLKNTVSNWCFAMRMHRPMLRGKPLF